MTTTAPLAAGRLATTVVVARGSVGLLDEGDLGGQGVVGHLLEVGVDVGHQVVAGDGGGGLEGSHHLPLGIDLELLLAGGAPQMRLVLVLEPGLAERIAGLVALGLARGQLGALMVPT